MSIESVRKSFDETPFLNFIGFKIDHFEEGNIRLKLSVKDQFMNSHGTLHGGIHASMLDVILGMTIRSVTKTSCTTINLNVNYLNVSDSKNLYATGKILKLGYRNVIAEGEIYDSDEVLIAKAVGTFKLIR